MPALDYLPWSSGRGRHAAAAVPPDTPPDAPPPAERPGWTGTLAIREASQPHTVKAQPAAVSPERAGYVYGIPPGGLNEYNTQVGASTQTDRKSLMQQLYEGYLACPWAWACVQAIGRTITAGGLITDFNHDTGEGSQRIPAKPPPVLALERLIAFCNPVQDIRQLCRNVIADLLVFADAYIEVVWWGDLPVALYNQDSPTTSPVADEHGVITKYVQVTDYGQRAEFTPREIIHISLDSARPGVFAVSPMQAALLPVTAWLFAAADGKEGFRKGLPPSFHADFPNAAKEQEMRRWRDQYRTDNLGPRNIGNPVITKGGVSLKELQQGRIADVLSFKTQCRDEIFAIFGVPPSKATVIESGNLGGGTGDAQDKTYRIDTCEPIAQIVLEKLNFHITQQAFAITDWHLKFGSIDYRDSLIIEQIRDMRLRNGSWTRNKYAADIGEPPADGGDDPVLVDRQNLVLWTDMAALSAAGVAAKSGANQLPPSASPPSRKKKNSRPYPEPDIAGDPTGGSPGSDDDDTGDDGDSGETARFWQAYKTRFAAALSVLPAAETAGDSTTAGTVYALLSRSFPAARLAWVRKARWTGPAPVPASRLDLSGRDTWAASSDGTAARYQARLRRKTRKGGHIKPVILIRTPGSAKDVIADGHHRVLAAVDEHQPVWAYTGRVRSKTGPWDELHASQLKGNR